MITFNYTQSKEPPMELNDGDIWFDTVNNLWNILKEGKWHLCDKLNIMDPNPNNIEDIEMVLNQDCDKKTNHQNYERAMGIVR